MKLAAFFLRFLGVLLFLLLAVGYYRERMIFNGLLAAFVGGLCAVPANRFPIGLKAKVALIGIGITMVLFLAPVDG